MAYEAKAVFMNLLEKSMAEEMTAKEMDKALRIVADVMEGFVLTGTGEKAGGKDDLLHSFLAALKVQGRSQKTIDRYRYIICRMMSHAGVSTRRITVYHLRDYIASESERGIQDSTLEGYREIFCAYFNWLQRENLIERNPAANLGAIKCAKKQKQIYSEVDVEKLKQHATLRDKAIISFLDATGCRISEAMALNRDAVDLTRLECVVHGKGNKERTVYLDPVSGMLIRDYLNSRRDRGKALFVGRSGRRLQPGGVRTMLKKLQAAAGIDQTVHPHKFRRTLATTLTRHGMPIQEVATILGHEKLDTTMKYVVLDNESTKSSYKRYR